MEITIENDVHVPVEKVWEFWTDPKHIQEWCHASDDWHAPQASNDVRVDGTFSTTMAAKDGSESFDFQGTYTNIVPLKLIEYTMGDGRKASVMFTDNGESTHISQTFETETINPPEMQRSGWQGILDNFKKYSEVHA